MKYISQHRVINQWRKNEKEIITGIPSDANPFFLPFFELNLSSDFLKPAVSKEAAKEKPKKNEKIKKEKPKKEKLKKEEKAKEPEAPDTIYSAVGALTYYNQNDKRWANSTYGGKDSIAVYGCGPTALAMIVTSFTEKTMTPADMAKWAYSHHYWVPGSGSKHNLIPKGAAAFGFKAKPFHEKSVRKIIDTLNEGHIIVALMGPGHFTANGHFIIIADYWSGNKVTIADPNSIENTLKPWDINLILKELNSSGSDGGPMWIITPN